MRLCDFMLGCLALCCAFRLHVFAAFLFDLERLAWLICSILQHMALHDGPCHTTLSTTSSMAPRTQALSGFGSMYRVRGILSPKTPWDLPRRTQLSIGNGAKSTTSKCIGRGTAHQYGFCFSAGLLCVLLYLALSRLGHQRISTARSSTP